MARDSIYYAIVLPGVGDADWGRSDYGTDWGVDYPVALYDGDPSVLPGTDRYIHIPALAKDLKPDHLSTRINPITGVVDVGSMSFVVPYADMDATVPSGLREQFNPGKFFTRRIYDADGLLDADVTAADTSIDLWSRDGAAFSAGDIIHLEREAIHLESLTSTSGNVQTFSCARGVLGTVASIHKSVPTSGASPDPRAGYDNRVYLNKRPQNTEVRVIEWDGDTLQTRRWVGILTQEPELVRGGTGVKITPVDVYGLFGDRTLNREAHGAQKQGRWWTNHQGATAVFGNAYSANDVTQTYGSIRDADDPVTVQMKDSIISGVYDEDAEQYIIGENLSTSFGTFDSSVLLGSPPLEDMHMIEATDKKRENPLYEVLTLGLGATDTDGNNFSYCIDQDVVGDRHNPITPYLYYLLSTGRGDNNASYDEWSAFLGAGVPEEWVDVDGMETLRSVLSGNYIYQDTLSYNGREFSPRDIRARWLTPFRLYPHLTSDSKMALSRLEVILSGDATSVSGSKIVLLSEDQKFGWEDSIQTLAANHGHPWESDKTILARDLSQGVTLWDPKPKDAAFELDVRALPPLDEFGNGAKRDAVASVLEWFQRPIPTYMLSIVDPDTILYPGLKVSITLSHDTPLLDKDGNRIATSDTIKGIVTEASHDYRSRTTDISIWGINDPLVKDPKPIAPSFEIDSWDGANDRIVCDRTQYGTDMGNYVSEINTEGEIEVWVVRDGRANLYTTGDGTTATTVATVNASTIYFDLLATPDDYTPQAGDFVRLTKRGLTSGQNYNDSYIYLANDNEQYTSGTPGDIWV